jgi:hypothetical protein
VLGTLDAGQGIPTLLEALNDERARIAIYALRYALLRMPQNEALTILRSVPQTQVTVAKEVMRLMGDLSSDAAYQELLVRDRQELHRDVRVALLRALWSYGERSETWEVFTRAAQSSDPALTRSIVRIPADGLSLFARKQLAALIALLLARPEAEVRIDVLERCIEYPLTDSEYVLFPLLVKSMNSLLPDECEQAAKAAFTLYVASEKDAALLGEAISGMLSNRQALQVSIECFLETLSEERHRSLPTTRAILAALAKDRLTIMLRLGIMVAGLPWSEVAPELMRLVDQLHADALVRAENAIQQAGSRPDADLFALEMALVNSHDERLRRLALAALIAQANKVSGWTDECIARLHSYREDFSALVAETAQYTFPA